MMKKNSRRMTYTRALYVAIQFKILKGCKLNYSFFYLMKINSNSYTPSCYTLCMLIA